MERGPHRNTGNQHLLGIDALFHQFPEGLLGWHTVQIHMGSDPFAVTADVGDAADQLKFPLFSFVFRSQTGAKRQSGKDHLGRCFLHQPVQGPEKFALGWNRHGRAFPIQRAVQAVEHRPAVTGYHGKHFIDAPAFPRESLFQISATRTWA